IYCPQNTDNDRDDQYSRPTGTGAGPEETEIPNQQIAKGRRRCNPRQPEQPAYLKADDWAECHAGVQVRSAGPGKPAPHFRKTDGEENTQPSAKDVRKQATGSRHSVDTGWEPKNPGAYNDI